MRPYKSVFVSRYVEYHFGIANDTGIAIHRFDFVRGAPLDFQHFTVPGFQSTLTVLVFGILIKCFECLLRYDPHEGSIAKFPLVEI
jgi:hypothetical protein